MQAAICDNCNQYYDTLLKEYQHFKILLCHCDLFTSTKGKRYDIN